MKPTEPLFSLSSFVSEICTHGTDASLFASLCFDSA